MSRLAHSEVHMVHRIGWLRAAVLGANDGIVSTASLVVGVAAAGSGRPEILIAGLAGLVAGAMSMAAGEYVSVSSQTDAENADIERERAEIAAHPDHELKELSDIYEERGLDRHLARLVAEQMMAQDALGAHMRDELGISETVTARPVQAALVSALTFAVGAALPLLVALLVPVALVTPLVAGATVVTLAALGALGGGGGGGGLAARRPARHLLGGVGHGRHRRRRRAVRRGGRIVPASKPLATPHYRLKVVSRVSGLPHAPFPDTVWSPALARPPMMQAPTLWPEVSVVLPARDEAASITALLRDIDRALAGMAHEIIVVDDGSRDGTAELVLAASAELPQLRLIRHARGQGQSAALHNGVRAARGRIVATLDADGQNPPAALPRLIAPLLAEGSNLGLVQGCCQNTAKAARPPLKGDCHCTLRAFPRATYTRLTYFHHLHRFLALEVRRRGQAVLLVEVARSHRGGGRSKYSGLHHALIGGIHLFGATWLLPRSPVAPGQEVTPPPQA